MAVLVEQRTRLGDVELAAQEWETSRPRSTGVGLQTAEVALEQQIGRAGRSDPLVGVGLGQPWTSPSTTKPPPASKT